MLKGFGERIRRRRRELDLTQTDVASKVPMNQSNYSKIERENQEPNLTQLVRICEVLNVPSDVLLGLEVDTEFEVFQENVEKISTGLEH